jgi:hypothetical protein
MTYFMKCTAVKQMRPHKTDQSSLLPLLKEYVQASGQMNTNKGPLLPAGLSSYVPIQSDIDRTLHKIGSRPTGLPS